MKFLTPKIVLFFLLGLFFYSCSEVRKLKKNEYLLHDNKIVVNGKASTLEELELQLYQKPNSKLLGFKPRVQLYNLMRKNPDSTYQVWLTKNPKRKERMTRLYSAKQVDRIGKSFFVSGYNDFLKRVGEAPVVLDSLKTQKSTKRLLAYYLNRGYFDAKINAKTDTLKNRKAIVSYLINTGNPFLIDSITKSIETPVVDSIYQTIVRDSYLEIGKPYTSATVYNEVKRISKEFRNKGLYHFQENNVKFDADTIGKAKSQRISLNVVIKDRTEKQGDTLVSKPFKIYKIGRVNIFTDKQFNEKNTTIDSTTYKNVHIYSSGKLRYKPKALTDAVFIEQGKIFSEDAKVLTSKSLSNLKMFAFPQIQFIEDGKDKNTLTANIVLSPLKRRQFNIKADFTTSNIQDFGISGFMGITFRNIFKGAEILDFSMRGSLGSSSKLSNPDNLFFNVREYGADLKLTIPRFFSPINTKKIIKKEMFPTTTLSLGLSKQTNIGLDKESYTSNFFYDWTSTKRKERKYRFDLFNLQFIRNLNVANYYNVYSYSYNVLNNLAPIYAPIQNPTTQNFYNPNTGNLTFEGADQFINYVKSGATSLIPQDENYQTISSIGERKFRLTENNLIVSSSFSYSINSKTDINDIEFYTIRTKIESAGNLLSLFGKSLGNILDSNGKQSLFGIAYSQYIKGEIEYIKHLHIRNKSSLAFRAFGGIAVPYGNSNSIPFTRSYFAGGSNDNRGWLAYQLGPGSSKSVNDFNEANLKLAMNLEYRFTIFGKLNGALFTDAGNIWNVYDNVEDENLTFNGIKSLKDVGLGAGFGFRYDLGFFVIRTDFGFKAYNPAKDYAQRWLKGMSINEGVFNIGINYPF